MWQHSRPPDATVSSGSFVSLEGHTHLNPVCEPSHLHHFRSCKSSVWITKGAIYLYTGIHFYGSFRPTFFTQFFLKLRERSINLIIYQIFSTIFPVDMCTWKSKASVQYSVFNYCGGRRERKMGLATQLIGFFLSHDSSLLIVARDSFLFFFLLWDHCVWKKKF